MAKNYLGNGWKAEKYDIINLSVNLEKLNQLTPNEYGDIKITVASMKEPNAKTKATHTVYENDYTPQGERTREPHYDVQDFTSSDSDSGLPF